MYKATTKSYWTPKM